MPVDAISHLDCLESASAKVKQFFSSMQVSPVEVDPTWIDTLIADSLASGIVEIPDDEFFAELYLIARSS